MALTDRLFFALLPDEEVAADMHDFAKAFIHENGLRSRPSAAERLHVTLAFLGDHDGLPSGLVEAAKRAAAMAVMPTFTAGFDRIVSFKGRARRQPLALLAADEVKLVELHRRLVEALALEGVKLLEGRFTPHVTLSYDDALIEEQAAGRYAWPVKEFVLMRSLIGRSRYIVLGRWPLIRGSA